MSHFHLKKDEILDPYNWKGNLNLLNIVMIGIAKELPKHEEKYELHRLIAALLSNQLNEQQRLAILESEYNIPINTDFRKDVNVMCNLSQGIKEDGIAIGEARGIAIGEARGRAEGEATAETKIVLNMHNNGLTPEQIATFTDKSIGDVKAIIEGEIPATVD